MKATIYLNGYIGENDPVNLKYLIGQVQRNAEATELDIILNSGGGEMYEGFAMRYYIKELNKRVKVNIIGSVSILSIATVVYLSVPRAQRFMQSGCKFMIHLPSGGVDGDVDYILDYANEIDDLRNELINIYHEELGIEKVALSVLIKNETWFSVQDCKDYGIASGIFTAQTNKTIFNTNIFNTMRQNKRNGTSLKDTINGIVNAALGKDTKDEKDKRGTKKDPKNETFTTATGDILEFASLEPGQTPEAGDEATIAGVAVDGEILMADGQTWIFDAGKFVSAKAAEENADEAEVTELKAEIEELEAELDEADAEIETLKSENEALKAENKNFKTEAEKFKNALVETQKHINGTPPKVEPKNSTRARDTKKTEEHRTIKRKRN